MKIDTDDLCAGRCGIAEATREQSAPTPEINY